MADPILTDIRAGTYSRLYLLYGEEDYLKDYYCGQLKKALISPEDEMNLNVWDGRELDADNLNELEEQAVTMPFFAEHRLIIVKESCLFSGKGQPGDTRKPAQIKSVADKLAAFLPKIPAETVLVFLETDIDRRSKLYHAAQKAGGRLCEYRYVTGDSLVRWILNRLNYYGRQIQTSAMNLLLERTGGEDMYLISNELDKLIAYTEGRPSADGRIGIMLEDVQALTSVTAEYQIFQLTDAIAARNQDLAMKMYQDLLQQKQSPIGIVILLYRQFDRFLQMRDLRQQGLDTDTIAERMNIPPRLKFTVSKSLRSSAPFTMEQLRQIVELCGQTDQDIVTGRMTGELAAQLLITLCTSRTLKAAGVRSARP